jgi:GNAT superfamily N-acetyltransferase
LDLAFVHSFLGHTSYWAQGRSWDVVRKSIEHSLCFGLYFGQTQIGFARVVTDYATFAWLCDVFVIETQQGRGLGKWLIESAVAHPALTSLEIFILATTDAHELYRRYGNFRQLQQPKKWMIRRPEPGHS